MSKPFNAGHLIQDIIYATTPWGMVDNAFGNPLPRLHLARVDSQAEDITATVDPNDPNNHEISPITRALLGLKPEMKSRDLQNDRGRFYNTEDGKNLQRQAATAGYQAIDANNQYRNTHSLRGDFSRALPNINALNDEKVTYSQIGLQNAGTGPDGQPVTPIDIIQRAGSFKALRDVKTEIKKNAGVPKPGATYPELQEQLKQIEIKNQRDSAKLADEIKYGSRGADGKRTDGTEEGRLEQEAAAEALETSKSARRVSEGNLGLNRTIARNAQTQQEYVNERSEWEHEDNKVTQALEREWLLDRDQSQFAANNETIRLQNQHEMDRFDKMLENDAEVRRSEDISDLMMALTMLGGSFLI
jgi:hypothetical protein